MKCVCFYDAVVIITELCWTCNGQATREVAKTDCWSLLIYTVEESSKISNLKNVSEIFFYLNYLTFTSNNFNDQSTKFP